MRAFYFRFCDGGLSQERTLDFEASGQDDTIDLGLNEVVSFVLFKISLKRLKVLNF